MTIATVPIRAAEFRAKPRVEPGNRIAAVLKRAVALSSDAVVLTIASPFIAIWFVYRTLKRWIVG
ncbi:MAG: hypothetical protein ACKVP4_09815 [Hyphomicrobium sp.]